jgi:hypothetical protein
LIRNSWMTFAICSFERQCKAKFKNELSDPGTWLLFFMLFIWALAIIFPLGYLFLHR